MLVGKDRAVVHRQIVDLPVHAVGTHDAALLVAGHAAAAHHVCADHAGEQRLHRQRGDRGLAPAAQLTCSSAPSRAPAAPRCAPAANWISAMRQQGAARTVHDEVGQRIVEHRRAVAAQLDLAAGDCSWKPSRSSASRACVCGKCFSRSRLRRPKAGSVDGEDHRVQRRRFELVADRPVDRLASRGSGRCRSSAARRSSLRRVCSNSGSGHHHRVQEGARAEQAVRIGRPERSSSAGELIAPPANDIVFRDDRAARVPRSQRAVAFARHAAAGAVTCRHCQFELAAPASRTSRRAPRSSAAGMVVTSIDCLALVGQPMPQEPRFQQPLTLRWIAAAAMPSAAAPRRSSSLFSFGGASQGPMFRRCSACGNQGDSASRSEIGQAEMLAPVSPAWRRRAKRTGPVDGGGAADAAPLQDVDRLVGGLARRAFLVERRIGLALALVEVGAASQRPFLDRARTSRPAWRQQFGGDAGAGAAADDGHVAVDLRRQGRRVGPAEDFPAACQAVANGIGLAAHARSPAHPASGLDSPSAAILGLRVERCVVEVAQRVVGLLPQSVRVGAHSAQCGFHLLQGRVLPV